MAPNAQVAPPPAAAAPAAAPAKEEMVALQYPNSDVVDVLRLYGSLPARGWSWTTSSRARSTSSLAKPIPRDEAIKIIEMNLLMNGYSLVPAENNISSK